TAAHGEGRVAVLTIPVDGRRGDFQLQPVFVPAIRGLAEWLSRAGSEPLYITSGSSWQLPAGLVTPVIRSPAGDLARPSGTSRFLTFREAGIHEVAGEGGAVTLVAVNPPASESDLAPISADELLLGVEEVDAVAGAVPAAIGQANEASQQWWRWILVMLLVILIVEAWVASSGWRGAAVPVAGEAESGGGGP
ncbi:MAG TPA: hypothetical protein PLL69_12780, partial [Gemmatimonadales bacterium]|nr:hypothetical protein [Gemmatimonadales bacterium]